MSVCALHLAPRPMRIGREARRVSVTSVGRRLRLKRRTNPVARSATTTVYLRTKRFFSTLDPPAVICPYPATTKELAWRRQNLARTPEMYHTATINPTRNWPYECRAKAGQRDP